MSTQPFHTPHGTRVALMINLVCATSIFGSCLTNVFVNSLHGGYRHSQSQRNSFFRAESRIGGHRSYKVAHTLEFRIKPSCTYWNAPAATGKRCEQSLTKGIDYWCELDSLASYCQRARGLEVHGCVVWGNDSLVSKCLAGKKVTDVHCLFKIKHVQNHNGPEKSLLTKLL